MSTKTNDLTQGDVKSQLLKFAFPILISNLFQQFYNLADTAIAGHLLGVDALSAIGATSSLNSLILTFATGLNAGFGIVIANLFGQKNEDEIKKAFAKSIVFNVITSLLVAILALLFINPILDLMNTPTNLFGQAKSYILFLLVFVFATMFYNLESNVLRALGDSKTPLYFIILSSLLNIILDYVFIANFKFGIKGAAIATIISQFVSAILCLIVIVKNFKILKLKVSDFKPNFSLSKKLLSAGMTMAVMNSVFSIGSIIMQSAINSLGQTIIAAHLASRKMAEMFMQPLVTVGTSASTFVSQNYGAYNKQRIKDSMKWANIYAFVFSILAFIVLFFFGRELASLITGTVDNKVLDNTSLYLRVNAPFYFVLGLLFNYRFSIQSIGSRVAPIVAASMELISKVLAAFLFIPHLGYLGACIAEPISWTLGAIYLLPIFSKQLKKAFSLTK